MLKILFRFNVALFFYGLVFTFFGAIHDYPQLRNIFADLRVYDERVSQRQWLGLFYFANEAGSGIKFFLTGDEYYLRHYPSSSHLLAARLTRAKSDDWQTQLQLAQMYLTGTHTAKDNNSGLYWLRQAKANAPDTDTEEKIELLIKKVAAECAGGISAAALACADTSGAHLLQ